MKKWIAFVLLCCLVLSGCTAKGTHSHDYASWWMADTMNHWHCCEGDNSCQERGNLESHNFEDGSCAVCGAVLLDYDYYDVEIYDEYGNPIYCALTFGDEELSRYIRMVYDYFDDGEIKTLTKYDENALSYKQFRRPREDSGKGGYYVHQTINYSSRGYDISFYNEMNDIIEYTEYDANGTVIDVLRFEYAYHENGKCESRWMYVDDVLNRVERYEFYDSGEYKRSEYLYYDDLGRVRASEISEYDENGRDTKLIKKSYGVLAWEIDFAYAEDNSLYSERKTFYRRDGSIMLVKHFQWDGRMLEEYLVKEVFYDRENIPRQAVLYDREGQPRQTIYYDREGNEKW